jgi:thiol-disulfide isomerase/thioredoxin
MLVIAGMAKLADQDGTRAAVTGFGVPAWAAGGLARLLPLAELSVAALLVPRSSRVVGAAGALVLLVIFSAAIAVSLLRGRAPECHCFGRLHSAPVSWTTLARNGVFIALAGAVLAAGFAGERPSAIRWLSALDTAQRTALAAGIAVAALAVLGALAFMSLMQSYGRLLLRLTSLEQRLPEAGIGFAEGAEATPRVGHTPGTTAPAFEAETIRGESISLDDLLAPGLPLLLLFTSPACEPCRTLIPKVGLWQRLHAGRLTIAAMSGGGRIASTIEAEEHGLDRVLIDSDLAVYGAYAANGTPSAVLVSPGGTIASYIASGPDSVERLVAEALSGTTDGDGLSIGTPAPQVDLVDVAGEPVALVDPAGKETLVLFWNPECGFCRSMHEQVLALEREAAETTLRIVVVSSGDEELTRAEGFSSSVALDPDLTANWALAIFGTPTAVLLDPAGMVASRPAIGAEAVFALAASRSAQTTTGPGSRSDAADPEGDVDDPFRLAASESREAVSVDVG